MRVGIHGGRQGGMTAHASRTSRPLRRRLALLLHARRGRRRKLAAVEHGVVALLAAFEAHDRREHVGAAPGLLELIHPPIRDLAGMIGILRAGAIGPGDDRNGCTS